MWPSDAVCKTNQLAEFLMFEGNSVASVGFDRDEIRVNCRNDGKQSLVRINEA